MMMMHTKTDSDETMSYDLSLPRSSKRADYYYVKSPSWNSPIESARPSNHSSGSATITAANQPRDSSASRISSSHSNDAVDIFRNVWLHHDRNVIDEERGDHEKKEFSGWNLFFIAIIGFLLIITCFCIIWGVSMQYKPQISIKSLTVHNFQFAQGSDRTGVPTKMVTMNCSMRMTVHNPAPFFDIYVSSNSVNLMYSELTVATGEIKKYHQLQKSLRALTVNLKGRNVPLYGAGPSLLTHLVDNGKIPMTLVFEVESRGYGIWKLVTTKYTQHVFCSIDIDSDNNNTIQIEEIACSYL